MNDHVGRHARQWLRANAGKLIAWACIVAAAALATWLPRNARIQATVSESMRLRIIDLGYRPCEKVNAEGHQLTAEIAMCPDGKRCRVFCEYEGMRFMTRDEAQL